MNVCLGVLKEKQQKKVRKLQCELECVISHIIDWDGPVHHCPCVILLRLSLVRANDARVLRSKYAQ